MRLTEIKTNLAEGRRYHVAIISGQQEDVKVEEIVSAPKGSHRASRPIRAIRVETLGQIEAHLSASQIKSISPERARRIWEES